MGIRDGRLSIVGGMAVHLLAFALGAFADEVAMGNGDRLTGRLLGIDRGVCAFETRYGALERLPQGEILWIRTSEPVALDLSTGDRLVGPLTPAEEGGIVVHTAPLGALRVQVAQVLALARATPPPQGQVDVAQVRGKGNGPSGSRPQGDGSAGDLPKVGEVPEEVDHEFLRESTVLLQTGHLELDVEVQYGRRQRPVTVVGDGAVAFEELRARIVSVPVVLRAGLFHGAVAFVGAPLRHLEVESVILPAVDANTVAETGIGDFLAGLNYQLVSEKESFPELLATVSFTAPTGGDPQGDAGDAIPLGSGYWTVTGGLTVVKSLDPVVIFGGIEYTHSFARQVHGVSVQPGEAVGYNLGVAFSVNDSVTLSGRLDGTFVTGQEWDGEDVPGSSLEPLAVRLGLTLRVSKDSYLEPSVLFGLDDDADDAVLGMAFTKRF